MENFNADYAAVTTSCNAINSILDYLANFQYAIANNTVQGNGNAINAANIAVTNAIAAISKLK